MLRNILTIASALALLVPVAAQARPLATPTPASLWGDHHDDDDFGDIELQMCTQTLVELNTGDDDRAYECGIQKGPSCVSRCTAEAVSLLCGAELGLAARSGNCVEDKIATCQRQCESDGATFCSPLKSRWDDDFFDDDDDDDDHDDSEIFIETETCLELNQDNDR